METKCLKCEKEISWGLLCIECSTEHNREESKVDEKSKRVSKINSLTCDLLKEINMLDDPIKSLKIWENLKYEIDELTKNNQGLKAEKCLNHIGGICIKKDSIVSHCECECCLLFCDE